MRAAVEVKPRAKPEIAIDPDANAAHQAEVQVWGTGIWLAAGRMCRAMVKRGAPYDFCPAAQPGEVEEADE